MIDKLIEKLEESKELVWTDDDEYSIGFNNGIDMAISIINEFYNKEDIKMSEVLRTCPFCGKNAEIITKKHTPNGYEYTPRCIDRSCAGRLTKVWLDREKAIEAWNRREDNK